MGTGDHGRPPRRREVPVRWADAGNLLLVGPLAAGQYRLELDLNPVRQPAAARTSFDLPLPRLAHASLELACPADLPAPNIPSALGRVDFDGASGMLSAQLGAADQLSIRWTGGMETAAANLEVEELVWMKVRPGTTVLDARFKYRVLSGQVRSLRLLTDSRLRLLSSPGGQSPIAAVHTVPGDPQQVELELREPAVDEFTIDLSFLATGASGVGNLRLPRLEASDARAVRRWLAVSVDSALQPKIQAGEDSRVLDLGEFLAAWGETEAKPHAAYSIPRGEPVWFLSAQPGEPQTSVEQTLALSFGRNSSELRFSAGLSIAGGVLFQITLAGPRGIDIDEVSLVDDDVERVARWTVDDQGRAYVFFNAPIDRRSV